MVTNEIIEPSIFKIKNFIHDKLRVDYKLSVENRDLYFGWSAVAVKDNREVEFTIQLKDFGLGNPDCKIGNFAENFYMRPMSQCNDKGRQYKSFRGFQHAVVMCLRANGWKFIKWVDNNVTI